MSAPQATAVAEGIRERYWRRTARSREQGERAQRYLPAGHTRGSTQYSPYTTFLRAGQGCHIQDSDGNDYLDLLNNQTALIHGHGHPAIVEVVSEQFARGSVLGAPTEPLLTLAETICERTPGIDRVLFNNSGTEATIMAIRTARAYTSRERIIKMDGGYHGLHDAVLVNMKADHAARAAPRSSLTMRGIPSSNLQETLIAPFNDLAAIVDLFERYGEEIAAVLVEPIPNAGGLVMPQEGYLQGLRDITRRYGALLIFDEVATYRLGRGGYQEVAGVAPDLTALAKIIGGGSPIGACGGRQEVMEIYDGQRAKEPLYVSGTYHGNVLSMLAGQVAMEHYEGPEVQRVNRLGRLLREGISACCEELGLRAQTTGYGSLVRLHWQDAPIVNIAQTARSDRNAQDVAQLFHLELLNRGILANLGEKFCISTPMTEADVDHVLTEIAETLQLLLPYLRERHAELVH